MKAWMRRHPWRFSALVWAGGVALVFAIQIVLAHTSHTPVNWTEAVAVAVIIPLVGKCWFDLGQAAT